jgi:XTP/dITP diphosphohydrolase
MLPKTLILATHNVGKIAEFSRYLSPLGMELKTAKDFGLSDPIEDAGTFVGNALIKARFIYAQTGQAALADDSGLCVNGLNGEPGVESAYYGGDDRNFDAAMARVNHELGDKPDRSAYFVSVLVFIDDHGREIIAEGRVNGVIAQSPRGVNGFGYDPIFIPDGQNKTFGEMTADQKKQFSHRANALHNLLDQLKV